MHDVPINVVHCRTILDLDIFTTKYFTAIIKLVMSDVSTS